MIAHLDSTLKAFKKAAEDTITAATVKTGVKNIEGWEEKLAEADFRGAKTIHTNLGKLKGLLQADELDPKAIGAMLKTLGEETGRVASHAEGKDGEKLKELADLLTGSADGVGG